VQTVRAPIDRCRRDGWPPSDSTFLCSVYPLSLLPPLQAPEVVMGKYSEHADMWSLGVVMFVSLFGAYPQPRAPAPARFCQ